MKNQVKEILNREAALQNELKAVVVEKEQLAINVLADANVLVKELGCAHLLNTSTESIVNIAINKGRIVEIAREVAANITINKGKVVKVVKEVEVKVEDTTRINKLTEEIEELKLTTSWQKDLIVALENKQEEYKKVIKEYEFEKEMSEAQTNSTINRLVDEAVKAAKEENAALKKKVKALEIIVNTPDIDEANDKDILVQAIKSKDAYIVELETKLQDKAYNAAEDGYVVDGVEVSLEVVKSLQEEIAKSQEINAELAGQAERFKKSSASFQSRAAKAENEVARLNNVIAELQAQTAKLEAGGKATVVEDEGGFTNEYLEYLASQEESIMAGLKAEQQGAVAVEDNNTKKEVQEKKEKTEKEIKTKEVVETTTKTVTGPEFVQLVTPKLGKGGNAKLFLTESCYLIASNSAKEITWLSKAPLSDEYKKQVEDMLVKQHNFNESRVAVSPITVQNEKGYMARVRGAEGVDVYSNNDVYSGYVMNGKEFVLYTYFPNTDTAIVEDLGKKILEAKGQLKGNTLPKDKKVLVYVNNELREMYREYQSLTADIRKQHEENIQKAKEQLNTNQAIADRIEAERRAKLEKAAANDPVLAAELNKMRGGATQKEETTGVEGAGGSILDSSIDTNEWDSLEGEFGAF